MADERWLLPEGVDELLPDEAWALERLRRALLDLCAGWGYQLVMPPLVEFLDSLLVGTGNDLELQTFKLIDQQSGKTLGVRADITPQVARIAARRLPDDGPTRLCFSGTVLRTRGDGLGGSRSPLQFGAELYGHAGVASDLEIIELMLASLATAGVGELHLDLGHVAIFRTLVRQAGLGREAETELFDLLQRKALPELDRRLPGLGLPAASAEMLLALPALNGDAAAVLSAARERLGFALDADPVIGAALSALEAISTSLRRRHPGLSLSVDLAELHGYHYHTGVVFAAYVPERGQQLARGGRYDSINAAFGRPRPATGFSTDLKTLMGLAARPERHGAIYAPADSDPDSRLDATITALRAAGERVLRALPDDDGSAPPSAPPSGCDRELRRDQTASGWGVYPIGPSDRSNE